VFELGVSWSTISPLQSNIVRDPDPPAGDGRRMANPFCSTISPLQSNIVRDPDPPAGDGR